MHKHRNPETLGTHHTRAKFAGTMENQGEAN